MYTHSKHFILTWLWKGLLKQLPVTRDHSLLGLTLLWNHLSLRVSWPQGLPSNHFWPAKVMGVTSEVRLGKTVAFVLLSPAHSGEVTCHVGSCFVERPTQQGTNWANHLGGTETHSPTAYRELNPAKFRVSLEVDPLPVETCDDCIPSWHLHYSLWKTLSPAPFRWGQNHKQTDKLPPFLEPRSREAAKSIKDIHVNTWVYLHSFLKCQSNNKGNETGGGEATKGHRSTPF